MRRWLCFEESHNSGDGYLPRLVDAETAQDAARQVGGLNRMVYVFPQEEARPFHTATAFGRVEAEPPRGGDFYSGNGRAAGAEAPPALGLGDIDANFFPPSEPDGATTRYLLLGHPAWPGNLDTDSAERAAEWYEEHAANFPVYVDRVVSRRDRVYGPVEGEPPAKPEKTT